MQTFNLIHKSYIFNMIDLANNFWKLICSRYHKTMKLQKVRTQQFKEKLRLNYLLSLTDHILSVSQNFYRTQNQVCLDRIESIWIKYLSLWTFNKDTWTEKWWMMNDE